MIITKIFNNNCVSTEHDNKEYIVTGAGVGFGMRVGSLLEEGRVEKRFEIIDDNKPNFESLIERIDVKYITITRQIIEQAERMTGYTYNNNITIALADHIAFSIERYNDNIFFPAVFPDEIMAFYPDEHALGIWAVEFIRAQEKIDLPMEDASYISLHLINATSSSEVSQFALQITTFIHDVLNIIETQEGISFDRNSRAFSRFLVHLKYLGKRVLEKDNAQIEKFPQDFRTKLLEGMSQNNQSLKIVRDYIADTYEYTINHDEELYLAIHLFQSIEPLL